jgi:hypothetical protein
MKGEMTYCSTESGACPRIAKAVCVKKLKRLLLNPKKFLGGSRMSYKNAEEFLPEHLLTEIQQYVDGAYLYIPRQKDNRRAWGTSTKSCQCTMQRNCEIFRRYRAGSSVSELSALYFLSDKTIYHILAKMKA